MPDEVDGDISSPVASTRPASKLEVGSALCLSGGGYRAMLFHVGALWRLYETGVLQDVQRVSSVSGGSITSAVLGLNWHALKPASAPDLAAFQAHVVAPIRNFGGKSIDISSVITGILLPGSVGDRVKNAYKKNLFGSATLQDFPDTPRFVINASNVQSGVLWRFMKPYMRDYRVGEVKRPTVELAAAVAASSAFPPVLSPFTLKLDPASFTPNTGDDLQFPPYTNKVVLTDGGVYDNLGLETAYKRYGTILVSDAGGKIAPEPSPKRDWARHAYRVLAMIDNQVRSLRKRQLINAYESGVRKGAFWGIRTNIADYELPDALNCPHEKTLKLAAIPTRLKSLGKRDQERLINWGYAVCDAAVRRHLDPTIAPPKGFPYPASMVG